MCEKELSISTDRKTFELSQQHILSMLLDIILFVDLRLRALSSRHIMQFLRQRKRLAQTDSILVM